MSEADFCGMDAGEYYATKASSTESGFTGSRKWRSR